MKLLRDNIAAIIICLATVVTMYAGYGYRIDTLEKQQIVNTAAINALRQTQQDENLQIQISLTKIQTDLEYLKTRLR